MTSELLSVQNVACGYGAVEVLHSLSLTVRAGEVVTLIGANGAGKTTLMLTLAGLRPVASGHVLFKDVAITHTAPHERVPMGLTLVPEGRKIFPRLTVEENLDLGAYTKSDPHRIRSKKEEIFTLFPILAERRSQRGGTLSGGEQQMLAIGRALMSEPALLLLDEPSMGVAPLFCEKIFQTIRALNEKGMTILLVEQNAHLALSLASRGYVLETGRITLTGSGRELLVDPRVKEAYLGH